MNREQRRRARREGPQVVGPYVGQVLEVDEVVVSDATGEWVVWDPWAVYLMRENCAICKAGGDDGDGHHA